MTSIVPTPRLAVVVGVAGIVLFLTPASVVVSAAVAAGVLLFVAVVADWVTMPTSREVSARRAVSDRLSLGTENLVVITVANESSWLLAGTLRDLPPPEFACEGAEVFVRAEPHSIVTYRYHVVPSRRGHYGFGDIYLRLSGALGLVVRHACFDAARTVEVYPNIKAISKYQLLARRGALLEMGIRAAPISGRGTSFESLRDYQPDDEFRTIDWKATARMGKPITQVHEVERSQNIVLAIDAGRMMAPRVDGIARLDRAINAALMVTYVAIASGDNVGLIVFGSQIQRLVPPGRGRKQLRAILQALHAVEAEIAEPDYRHALRYLAARAGKRSLVVLFTELSSRESSRRLVAALQGLVPRHLPLCVTLRDTSAEGLLRMRPGTSSQVYAQAVAEQLLIDREDARRALSARGALVLDAPAEEFSVVAVNKYLEIKAANLL